MLRQEIDSFFSLFILGIIHIQKIYTLLKGSYALPPQ